MIRARILACLALVALGGCVTAPAGTPTPRTEAEKMQLGVRLATLLYDETTISNLMDSMSGVSLPSDKSMCEAAVEDRRADCLALMVKMRPKLQAVMKEAIDKSKAIMPDVMKDMAAVMTEIYTPAELAKMVDFYSSPEGQAVMKKQPEIMKRVIPEITARLEPGQIETAKKIAALMQEAFAEEAAAATDPG